MVNTIEDITDDTNLEDYYFMLEDMLKEELEVERD